LHAGSKQHDGGVTRGEFPKLGLDFAMILPSCSRGPWVENHPTTKGLKGRFSAQNKTVSGQGHNGTFCAELHPLCGVGLKALSPDGVCNSQNLGRPQAESDMTPTGDGRRVLQHVDFHIKNGGWAEGGAVDDDHASGQVISLDSSEVHGDPLACAHSVDGRRMHLQASDPRRDPHWLHPHGTAIGERVTASGACDNCPEPPLDKASIDWQPKWPVVVGVFTGGVDMGRQVSSDFIESSWLIAQCRVYDGRPFEEGSRDDLFDIQFGKFSHFVIHEIALGEGNEAVGHAQQTEDRQVLTSLGHDALVRCHDQDDYVESGCACDHGSNQLLMPGNVDECSATTVGEVEGCKAERDGNSALSFFRQLIEVHSGQGANKRCLAVVDVTGCADDEVLTRHGATDL